MARFLSFRMDDGLITGAHKAAAALAPGRASFFVVTERVRGSVTVDSIPLLKGADFGSVAKWRAFAAQGHDIQSHSATHANFGRLTPDQQEKEVRDSLSVIRKVHGGPYVFCFPYNQFGSVDLAALGLSAAGFVTRPSNSGVFYNFLDDRLELFRLKSWGVRERHFQTIVDQLARDVPEQTWTILGFHSLDEGFEPWSTDSFVRLVSVVRKLNYRIVSVGEMVGRIIGGRRSGTVECLN